MKKALDQTVRELKREVNKKVLKVPGIEQKVLDATSNEPWGPHGQLLLDISEATRNYHEYQMIMNVMWKRINDTGKNWRHVYKALIVLDYLVAHGSERIIDEIREHAYQISTLSNFQYIDSGGRDQGSNVRRKCQSLVALINDKERIQEVRQKAMVNKDKYRSPYSMGGANRPSSYSGNGGNGDRYDDDRFEGRYGNKDEDRNGYGRERDWGNRDDDRYDRGGDLYNRDGDRYGRDSDERFGRDSYRDDDYRGGRGNDDQFGSRNKNFDGDRGRSFDDDDHYSSRSGGGRTDEASHGERRLEQNLSEQNVGAPPGYEEAIRDAHNNVRVEGSRDGGTLAAPAPKAFSPSSSKAGLPSGSTIQSPSNVVPEVSASSQRKEINEFDEFDPRGSVLESAAQPAACTTEMDLFGNPSAADPIDSLALVPVTSYEGDTVTNLGFGTNFVAMPLASTAMNQPSEDPFGDSPFKATPQGGFPAQQQDFTPPSGSIGGGFQPLTPAAPKTETIPSFDFGDSLGGLTYAANGPATSVPSQGAQPEFQSTNMNLLPQSGPSAPLSPQADLLYPQGAPPVAPTNLRAAPMDILSQSAPPLASQAALTTWAGPAAKPQPPSKDKLEPKSTVWADTLSRGLVNLDISGSKINPLADIGIDFDSINRMEKRKEKKSSTAPGTSTIAMGRAMGAGSGIGRTGANGLAPSPNLMTMGYGMGGGGGAGRGLGLGPYGGGMNQQPMGLGMGMNMGVGQGAPMRPLTGVPPSGLGVVPGVAYNPTYGSQQAHGGGYR